MYETVYDIELANRQAGQHWFDPDTKRFFQSRYGQTVYGKRFFISSEQFDDSPRLYTIREALPNGHVKTVGEFQAYASHTQAVQAIQKQLGN